MDNTEIALGGDNTSKEVVNTWRFFNGKYEIDEWSDGTFTYSYDLDDDLLSLSCKTFEEAYLAMLEYAKVCSLVIIAEQVLDVDFRKIENLITRANQVL